MHHLSASPVRQIVLLPDGIQGNEVGRLGIRLGFDVSRVLRATSVYIYI
jgi:hypothetical protein